MGWLYLQPYQLVHETEFGDVYGVWSKSENVFYVAFGRYYVSVINLYSLLYVGYYGGWVFPWSFMFVLQAMVMC